MNILGIHGGVTLGQHEPAAALIVDGNVEAVCEEERYLRFKSGYGHLPYYSIQACLRQANIRWEEIDLIVSPGSTYKDHSRRLRDYLTRKFGSCPKIELIHHKMAHLVSAFFGSGFQESLVLSLDATGDGSCGMLAYASKDRGIQVYEKIPTRNSIGFFYTLMTYYLGFVDGDEYKVMGLAPYGKANIDLTKILKPAKEGWKFDNSFVRKSPVIKSPFEVLYSNKLEKLLGVPGRVPHENLNTYHRNLAASTQGALEDCLLSSIKYLSSKRPDCKNLCYAGGVALNCSANQKLYDAGVFKNFYVSPVSSDRGLALGCAYYGSDMLNDKPQPIWNCYLGSSYSSKNIKEELESNNLKFKEVKDPALSAAQLISKGKIIGWYQGRSEAGARALGNRSIVAAASDKHMREKVNARIKYREEFRPFAPSVLFEDSEEYFTTNGRDLPFMSFTAKCALNKRKKINSVVHVDGTSRVQTVRSSDNEMYYDLIKKYKNITGTPLILNTSFNLKGQPIVETPRDAIMTFFGCGLDALVLGRFIVEK